MKLIAAADKNWAIGKDGELLVRISEDMKNFSAITTGNVIVMGRKTLESFPGGKPLPNRVNIVLTHEKDYNGKGAIVVHIEEELQEELSKYDTDSIFVTGGESIYRMLLPYFDTAYITRLDYAYEADAFFPNLDENPDWEIVADSEEQTYFDLEFYFLKYQKVKQQKRRTWKILYSV